MQEVRERDEADTTLRDGTRVSEFVDARRRRLSARVHSDPEIYDLEMDRIFTKAWVFVGHESEIPNSGDYMLRKIGEDPVIVTRDDTGAIQVLLNVCSHRGMQVCRSDYGNAAAFSCPYHGFTYDGTGQLVGIPYEKHYYGEGTVDKSEMSLPRARVDAALGLIFATWDQGAPTLADYLGDNVFYMGTVFDRTDKGLETVGPPMRWTFHANWKLPSEQNIGIDGYHNSWTHRSMIDLGIFGAGKTDPDSLALVGTNVSSRWAHSARIVDFSGVVGVQKGGPSEGLDAVLRSMPPPGLTAELLDQLDGHLTLHQKEVLALSPPFAGGVFPNFAWLAFQWPAADGSLSAILTIRTFLPRGPDKVEFVTWVLVEKDAPEDVKAAVRKTTIQTFSSSGMFEVDDAEMFVGIQRSVSHGAMARRQALRYYATTGDPDTTSGLPGLPFAGFSKDDCLWKWWLTWDEFMTNRAW
jgi:nitrite reductase/ring-hydroxylating ferredoxin subunit